ncbi:hypothetical protein BH11CYA1_BH11CYA1_37420 [soil metagenome]
MPDLCKNCGKPPLADKAGSFTSYLFVHNYCQCKVPLIAKPTAKRTNTSFRSTNKQTYYDNSKQVPISPISSDASSKSKSNAALKLGTIIGGTFKILSIIGSGGMGIVYAAEHVGLKRQFALKILSPELVNEQTWKRFQAEAKTLGSLHHSTLVNVFDLGIHDQSLPYYTMDLLKGRTLEQILIDDGPLYLDEAIEIFLQVLDGLAYAHRNDIIHRDLKPGNIMICEIDGGVEVKILDFGISKFLQLGRQNQSLTMVGETFGSPFYMSPEQGVGGSVDARSDIYSIGCALFEALTAYVPFDGSTQMEIMMMHEQDEPPLLAEVDPETKFPDSIEYVVAKCLEKHPDDRYQSAKELAIDLGRIKENKYARSFFEDKKPFKSVSQRRTGRAASESAADNSDKTANSKQAILLLSILAVVAAVTAGATVIDYSQSIPSLLPFTTKAKTKGNTTPAFFSKLSDNGTDIEFTFPDFEIGLINTTRKTIGSIPAKGKVSFPINKHLYFFTTAYSASHPEVIKAFRPDDLYSYVARYRIESKEQLRNTLVNLKQLTGLKYLELAECELEDDDVDALNALSFLRLLDLKNTNLGPYGLRQFHLLKQLKTINYDLNKHIPVLLETIAGSTHLETLHLSTPDQPLTLADIKLLLTLKNLAILNVENTGITDEMFRQIVTLPHLTTLNVRGCKVSSEAVQAALEKYGNRLSVSFEAEQANKPVKQGAKHSMPEFYQPK